MFIPELSEILTDAIWRYTPSDNLRVPAVIYDDEHDKVVSVTIVSVAGEDQFWTLELEEPITADDLDINTLHAIYEAVKEQTLVEQE